MPEFSGTGPGLETIGAPHYFGIGPNGDSQSSVNILYKLITNFALNRILFIDSFDIKHTHTEL